MKNWANAPENEIVCFCSNVTKGEIAAAIAGGAESVSAVSAATGAGCGGDCAAKNPSGKCCHRDIRALLNGGPKGESGIDG